MTSRQRSGGILLGSLDDYHGQVVRPRSTSSSIVQDSQARSYVYLRLLAATSLLGMILLMVAGHHERHKATTSSVHFFSRRDLAASTPAVAPVTAPTPAPLPSRKTAVPTSRALDVGAVGITPSKPAFTIVVKAPAPAPSAKAPMKLKGGLTMAPAPVPAASEKVKTAGGLPGTAPVPGPAAAKKVSKPVSKPGRKIGAPAPGPAKAITAAKQNVGTRGGKGAGAPAYAPAPGLGGVAAAFRPAAAPRSSHSQRGASDKPVSSYSVGGISAPAAAPSKAPAKRPAAAPALAPAAAPGPATGAGRQPGSGYKSISSIFG
ncbi:hypothetical protein COCSUDRAFT_44150 [Coccomyxa subellipsoidea C-169]|uniref:Uncharacterized protein n=1 Tax=Coccomyxa subellipsoidea (strain C-169) TaxID=574566 RepID=I0YP90_COCSC|nr:hypothetical protein COCSUDRAFT_44150 [Coccomyxa subellipsoidea C-169]EIE20209.1 hypothetical protein COCSUDRAFT_44150 [Coccomyxa subellipsoidea C-169]|eukprot:XP_005644753.1 hypothetical protein COCSUDRAFT_44150 [Coccomyxa subellipsoidea C-169]